MMWGLRVIVPIQLQSAVLEELYVSESPWHSQDERVEPEPCMVAILTRGLGGVL